MTDNTSTLQIVLNCIKELTANTGMAPRAAIIETTGLSPHIIKERIDELLESGQIKRRERGVYQHVTVFAPARAISRTVLPDGLAVIEVGDTVLHLTPHEEKRLSSMYGSGAAVQPAATTAYPLPPQVQFLSSEDVSEMLGCSSWQVEEYARNGVLPGVRMGSKSAWVFPPEALSRAINRLAEEEAAKRATPPAPRAAQKRVRPQLA
jgi:hypothetical protein